MFCGDFSSVRKKNVESFHFREDSSARAAFASAKYNYSLVFVHIISTFSVAVVVSMFGVGSWRIVRHRTPVRYLIFSRANVATARIRPTSQKRVTIFASGIGCDGHLIFAGMSIFW